jgi:hypothetical protein
MKVIIRVDKIVKKGKKAVKMNVRVEDIPDYGPAAKLLKNKVFSVVYDSAGVKEGYKVVDNILTGGDTNTAIFPTANGEEIDDIASKIIERYEEAISGVKNLRGWHGRKEVAYRVREEEYDD